MSPTHILEQVVTLGEAVELAKQLGHPIDRANMVRYAQQGRIPARKSKGTWLTTRDAVRGLVVSMESESRGRPRPVEIKVPELAIAYTHTPELADTLERIQAARKKLRAKKLSPEREAHLWEELTTRAIYHTNRMEGNDLTFEEAEAIINAYKLASTERSTTLNEAQS